MTHCLACHGEELRRIRAYRTKTTHGRKLFGNASVCVCRECALVQVVPRPSLEALSTYYAEDYRKGCRAGSDVSEVSEFPKDNLFYYNRGQSICELVSPHVRADSPRILDVGAGFGHILHAFGERFPRSERVAIEFSQPCVHHLRKLGVVVHDEPVDELLPRIGDSFDIVTLSHSFEHLLDPRGTLGLIRDRLAPDGVLYIEVPNIPEDAAYRYPDHVWVPRFDEPHITFFSEGTLRGTLDANGYRLIFCDAAGPPYSYVSALRYRLPPIRWLAQDLIPEPLFRFLRKQRFTASVRMSERDESFYAYGDGRIWLRSLSRRKVF